ncbi:hypothetical protein CC86DRAFT_425973 [Ophiobolus disseminans]|uniref:Uncharacterized protein n=1 Tax=Ophiobolus disseminans TaxID=1469910 RepID=A0A6A6ZKH6_9PLEO|nr:hypothetical protein CC86DRAFT_425973 [Ophiobolus disseminans]
MEQNGNSVLDRCVNVHDNSNGLNPASGKGEWVPIRDLQPRPAANPMAITNRPNRPLRNQDHDADGYTFPRMMLRLWRGTPAPEEDRPILAQFDPFTLFFPYPNWETRGNLNIARGPPAAAAEWPNPNHPRRTLDQFYYPGIRDTSSRDEDQTVSEWTGKKPGITDTGRPKATNDSHVIMIDQLWIWALDSGIISVAVWEQHICMCLWAALVQHTLLSCFPSRDFGVAADAESHDFVNVLIRSVEPDYERCNDLVELTVLLVTHSIKKFLAQDHGKYESPLSIYQWAITSKLVLTQKRNVLGTLQEQLQRMKPKPQDRGTDASLDVDISHTRVRMINTDHPAAQQSRTRIHCEAIEADILNINSIDGAQATVVALIDGYAGLRMRESTHMLEIGTASIASLKRDTEQIHRMVLELLDLEQKSAGLQEACAATTQARAANTQGRAVIVFTIVTVIFVRYPSA